MQNAIAGDVVVIRTMHRYAIVPNKDVPGSPFVAVEARWASAASIERFDHARTRSRVDVAELAAPRGRRKIQCDFTGDRMAAKERMAVCFALFRKPARLMKQRSSLQPRAYPRRQPGCHRDLVAKEGRSAVARQQNGAERRERGRAPNIARVRVKDATRWCRSADVRDDIQLRPVRHGRFAIGEGQFAKAAQEPNESLVIDSLIAEYSNACAGDEAPQFLGAFGIQRIEVETVNF